MQLSDGLRRRIGGTLTLSVLVILIHLLANPLAAQDQPFLGGWRLDAEASTLRFQSVKNETIVESNRFAALSGGISEDGTATIEILLDSIDTSIDLRNVRMRFLFFETFTYPEATITAKIDAALLDGLTSLRRKSVMLPYSLDLHGVTRSFTAEVTITLLSDNKVAVATASPISVAASDFNLIEGVNKLKEAANVEIIPSATVTFDFLFDRAGAQPERGPTAIAAPSRPASAALETDGDFDLEACLGRFEILSRSGNIYFQPGSATLEDQSTAILETIVDIVRRCPTLSIEVAGHTDAIGSEATNQKLSEDRAESVSRYLINQGISSRRFRVAGYGEARPIADNATPEGRKRNRRIEFSGVRSD